MNVTEADVIVVGAGSGGCTVARRLVDAGVDVLVLEGGPEDTYPPIHDPSRSIRGDADTGDESVVYVARRVHAVTVAFRSPS